MYRFLLAPKWLAFHLLVAGVVVAFIGFGFWQLDRHDQRREFNATLLARSTDPALDVTEMARELDGGLPIDDLEWRAATATGTYLPAEQILIVNRSQNGRAGDNIVMPLALDDGRVLLVNRGFVPLGEPVAAAPDGTVTVTGIVRLSEERRRGQISDPASGELLEAQRLDIERLAAQLPAPVVPFALELVASTPSESGPFPEPVTRPALDSGPHLSYAVQWFIFAVAVAVGWVLAVRRSIATRRNPQRAAGGNAVSVNEPAT